MSTKTTFKRIALVAVAALGLGVLSVAPSQATAGVPTVTTAAGSASVTAGAANETATAATISISGLLSASTDTYSVTIIRKSAPATGASVAFRLAVAETTTSTNSVVAASATLGGGDVSSLGYNLGQNAAPVTAYDSTTAFTAGTSTLGYTLKGGAGYVGATFGLLVDSATTRVAGTYTYTVLVQPYEANVAKANSLVTADVTFTISKTAAAAALAGGTVSPALSTAYLNSGSSYTTASDSSVAAVATNSGTIVANIQVNTYTVDALAAPESVTVTVTGAGLIGNGGVYGKSITVIGTGGSTNFPIIADGTAGTASIVVKTTTVTFPAKTVTFFAKNASTITLAVNKPVIGVSSSTDVVRATALDANGNVWGGQAYIVAATAADALIAGSSTPVACTFNAAKGYHECPVAGIAKGTANFNVIDASTVATAKATSAATAAVRVSTGVATTAKISFDKATYAPGEKATVLVTVLDADGNALPASTITAAFAAVPTSNVALGSGSDAFTTDITLAAATSSSSKTTAGSQQYTVYMPLFAGDITITATGSTGLAAAGRVAISATASVVNSSVDAATDAANEATDAANAATDAALAAADAADAATAAAQDASDAVAALSATVAKLVASLKAQLTSLTNLVIKIQKKVKA